MSLKLKLSEIENGSSFVIFHKVCDVDECSCWAKVCYKDTEERASVWLCAKHEMMAINGITLPLVFDYLKGNKT